MDDRSFSKLRDALPSQEALALSFPESTNVESSPSDYFARTDFADAKPGEAVFLGAGVASGRPVKYEPVTSSSWQVALVVDNDGQVAAGDSAPLEPASKFVLSSAGKPVQRRRKVRNELGDGTGSKCKRKSVGSVSEEDGQSPLCCKLRKATADRGGRFVYF